MEGERKEGGREERGDRWEGKKKELYSVIFLLLQAGNCASTNGMGFPQAPGVYFYACKYISSGKRSGGSQ